jgi:hypothetical protein
MRRQWPGRARRGAAASIQEALHAAEGAPPRCDQGSIGWVALALQNAFHELLHARSLEEGVVNTVRRGGDTDTNAAIAGALLGAVYGREAIPAQWRLMVLSCHPHIQSARPSPHDVLADGRVRDRRAPAARRESGRRPAPPVRSYQRGGCAKPSAESRSRQAVAVAGARQHAERVESGAVLVAQGDAVGCEGLGLELHDVHPILTVFAPARARIATRR